MTTKPIKAVVTRGYQRKISEEVKKQISGLLNMLSEKAIEEEFEVDYLQVFRLSVIKTDEGMVFQRIEHIQEMPEYKTQIEFEVGHAIHEKLYVITDDYGDHYVMTFLLASEY